MMHGQENIKLADNRCSQFANACSNTNW